ncbi:hypothetical protein GGX14DRAFT_397075 [Mycena pura]|uniref:Uncharacterized protein n=1 Tax=Mycena pura TaxID=153505 RepID=A0AAD6YAS4_9AGAR|nr:hypothetical protein GGX14DRAFT_397075 [Mycena pura]
MKMVGKHKKIAETPQRRKIGHRQMRTPGSSDMRRGDNTLVPFASVTSAKCCEKRFNERRCLQLSATTFGSSLRSILTTLTGVAGSPAQVSFAYVAKHRHECWTSPEANVGVFRRGGNARVPFDKGAAGQAAGGGMGGGIGGEQRDEWRGGRRAVRQAARQRRDRRAEVTGQAQAAAGPEAGSRMAGQRDFFLDGTAIGTAIGTGNGTGSCNCPGRRLHNVRVPKTSLPAARTRPGSQGSEGREELLVAGQQAAAVVSDAVAGLTLAHAGTAHRGYAGSGLRDSLWMHLRRTACSWLERMAGASWRAADRAGLGDIAKLSENISM